jgi:hypothetical protein
MWEEISMRMRKCIEKCVCGEHGVKHNPIWHSWNVDWENIKQKLSPNSRILLRENEICDSCYKKIKDEIIRLTTITLNVNDITKITDMPSDVAKVSPNLKAALDAVTKNNNLILLADVTVNENEIIFVTDEKLKLKLTKRLAS